MDSDGEGSRGRLSTGLGSSLSESKARRAQVSGVVIETLPSALYSVRLDDGPLVMAHIADRIDRNFVRILVGDKVRVELTPQDVGRGRIIAKIG
jgi:translation initiation factor IF-1